MDNSIIGEFSVLSPSQKRELERNRKEKEARKTAEAIRRAEAARKAREAAKFAEEKRLAAIRAENAARESKKNTLRVGIAILYILIIVVIWIWIHYSISLERDWQVVSYYNHEGIDRVLDWIFSWGIWYFLLTSIVVIPILAGILSGIVNLRDKIKKMQ